MKKVSLLVGTVLFAGITAFGQNQIGSGANNIEEEYVLEEAAAGTAVMTNRKAKVSKSGSLAAPGQVFVSENFSSGKIPSNWTVKTNSSQAGGWVWTDKGSKIFNMTSQMKAGIVWANSYNKFDPTSPFGGYKESGFGREGGLHGLKPYLNL